MLAWTMARRLFIALELPEDSREALAAVATPLPGARWLAAEQLHLTLAFLGNVDVETEQRLRHCLALIRVPSFGLRLHGVGVFGGRRPTVIWAGVEPDHEGLLTLHRQVHRTLEAVPITVDAARFRPHITLARLKEVPHHMLRPWLRTIQTRDFGVAGCRHFSLFASTLGPAGAVHDLVERYTLTDTLAAGQTPRSGS